MTATDIKAAFARHRPVAVRNATVMLSSLAACVALVLGWRYLRVGALELPQPATDYFALAVFSAWLLVVAPWQYVTERRSLRRHGLICVRCARAWYPRVRPHLLRSGVCPYCHAELQAQPPASLSRA